MEEDDEVRRELVPLLSLVRSTLDVEVGMVREAARGRLRLEAGEEAVVEAAFAEGADEHAVRLDEEGALLSELLVLLLLLLLLLRMLVVAEDEEEDEQVVAELLLSLRECHTV